MFGIAETVVASRPTWPTLASLVRTRVRRGLQQVPEEEVDAVSGRHTGERRTGDAASGYRNGFGNPRQLALPNGTITLQRPRVRGLEERFVRRILPLFQRRTPDVAALWPELDLHGRASGDFELALRGLLGDAAPLSASAVQRLTHDWQTRYATWKARGWRWGTWGPMRSM